MVNACPFLVRTFCATYNHEHYITDALNGFVMQQTTFPVVYTIVDDASTDNTPVVLKRFVEESFDMSGGSAGYEKDTDYGHVTFAQHKTNKNCYFAVIYLKENHYSKKKSKAPYLTEWMDTKYIALCEGDDYWTDPMKLQKQVDFLEAHVDYSMCFHAAEIKLEGVDKSKIGAKCEIIESREYTSTQLFEQWIVPTAAIVYRRSLVDGFKMKHPEWLTRGDVSIVLRCSHTGKVYGMSDLMSVYRMQPNSVSHNVKYRGDEVFQLPNHFRCIYYNFLKVDKAPIKWSISHAYYSRMKRQTNVFCKAKDFFMFVIWDPRFAIGKLTSIVKRNKE